MFTKEEIEIIECGLEKVARYSEELEKKAEETKEESKKILELVNSIYKKINELEVI